MTDYTVLRGYRGREVVFRLDRVGKTLVLDPADPNFAAVDKVIFFAEPPPQKPSPIRWVLPTLPRSLQIQHKTASKVGLSCHMRAFIRGRDKQFVLIEADIGLRADGTPEVATLKVPGWTPFAGHNSLAFEKLATVGFSNKEVDELSPRFARVVGIGVDNVKTFTARLQFADTRTHVTPFPPEDDTAPLTRFEVTVALPADQQELTAFGLRFQASDLPSGHSKELKIVVRQPRPTKRDDPFAWPANHWIAELDVPSSPIPERWNVGIVTPYRDALHRVQDGRPISLLPTLPAVDRKLWRAKYSLVDTIASDDVELESFVQRLPKTGLVPKAVNVVPRTLEPQQPIADVELKLESFTTADTRQPLTIECTLAPPAPDSEADLAQHNEGIHFAIDHKKTPRDQIVRVGALDLFFTKRDAISDATGGIAKVSFRPKDDAPDAPGMPRIESLVLALGAVAIRPGNQDPIPGEEFNESSLIYADPEYDAAFRRSTPLVVDLKPRTDGGLTLTARESAIEHESQTLSMTLAATTPPLQDLDVVVVDTHPFLVSRVVVPATNGAQTAVTSEIGNWSNRSADLAWEIASAAAGFDLVLPPQGIGETMERRSGDFLDDSDGVTVIPADFRFTPNARLRLRSSFFKQRFVEVPWNLRRVLGYPGQRAAGASVDNLAFELLYGMSARVENRRLRLAELAARLGELPGRQEPILPWRASTTQTEIYRRYRDAWKNRYPSLLSRLGILEPYQVDLEGALTLTHDDGVAYLLRAEAHLADPIGREKPPPPFDKPGGLRGGWSWGFESANVLDAVLRTPRSGAALLARPFFSALGGWGYQKASFDRDRSTIYSDTAMGRTFSISIERIGRVGAFWNRAKHVIVYERTVMPTLQFAGEQDLLAGLPVLRKVREYVEILQDERTYPEFGEAPIARGFVRACFFPEGARRINVNSRWGEDVGRIGWKVPLWRPDADPRVYPRPTVTVKVAGDHPDKLNPLTLSQPDKLYFFTNTEPSLTADTDAWPAVEGVDYPRFTEFEKPKQEFGTGTPTPADRRAPVPAVVAGLGGFTFALDPTPHAVDVVHARAEDAIAAVLRNVTVARGPLQLPDHPTPTVTFLRDVADETTRALATLAHVPADLKKKARETLGDLATRLDGFLKDFDKNKVCARIGDEIRSELDRATKAQGDRVPLVDQITAPLHALRTTLHVELERIRNGTTDVTEAARQAALVALDAGVAQARTAVRLVRGGVGELQDAVARAERVVAEVRTAIAGTCGEIVAALEAAQQWTDELRAKVTASAGAIDEAVDCAERAVDDAGRAVTGPFPDMLRTAFRTVIAGVRALTARMRAVARASDAIALAKLAQYVRATAATIDTDLASAIAVLQDLASKVAFAPTPIEERLSEIEKALRTAIAGAAQWKPLSASLEREFDDFFAELDENIAAQIDKLLDLAAKRAELACRMLPSPDALKTQLLAALAGFEQLFDAVFADVTPVLSEVRRFVEQLGQEVNRAIHDAAGAAGKTIEEIRSSAQRTLRLVRAFGEVPRVPGLGFDLPEIAYHFIDLEDPKLVLPHVALSPVIAQAGQFFGDVAHALSPFGTGIPTIELLDRVVPFELEHFDLASVFPDFAGLKLDGLFSNIRMPSIANDNVRVTHGFDQQAMRGWVQVDADVPFDQPITVLSIVGITLTLVSGRFRATSRIDAQAGQSPQQTFNGEIHGLWRLQVGGFELVEFVDTRLRFDDRGTLRFDVSPDRVKLQAALSFISQLMESFGYTDSGFSIRVTPTGVLSTLDLPLPDIQGGSFGLANLRLGAQLGLEFLPTFAIAARFYVGSKSAPFSITIFILGGAGWVDARVRYVPSTKEFQTAVSIGITAAASLAIALGPIRGGIYAYFGVTVEYESSTSGASDLRVGLLLMFRGEVTLLGFLSVGLCLALEGQYTSSGGLIGRGRVSYSIKICWCVSIEVSAEVSYTFGSSSSRKRAFRLATAHAPLVDPYTDAATAYVEMFA